MLNSQIDQVMRNIEKLAADHPSSKKILDYFRVIVDRMDYKKYLQIGCGLIGSGAIESAHRIVVQKRDKSIRPALEQKRRAKHAHLRAYNSNTPNSRANVYL
ncbi:MAG: hypothetical protein ACKOC0_09875 [Cytophagales bacterium]